MAKTLLQKVWDLHTVRTLPTGQTQLFIGLHLVHEVTSPQAFDGLRMTVWKLLESKFREALADFNERQASRISTPDLNRGIRSFVKVKRASSRRYSRLDTVDYDRWSKFCKRASLWMSMLPRLSGSWVEFDVSQETRIFVSTEGSVTVQNSHPYGHPRPDSIGMMWNVSHPVL